jgi:hypothetical protein
MRIQPTQTNKPQTTFGILKKVKYTPYGYNLTGEYKGKRIEIYNAHKYEQKLQYVADSKTLKWIKSKLTYFENGIKKICRSNNLKCI